DENKRDTNKKLLSEEQWLELAGDEVIEDNSEYSEENENDTTITIEFYDDITTEDIHDNMPEYVTSDDLFETPFMLEDDDVSYTSYATKSTLDLHDISKEVFVYKDMDTLEAKYDTSFVNPTVMYRKCTSACSRLSTSEVSDSIVDIEMGSNYFHNKKCTKLWVCNTYKDNEFHELKRTEYDKEMSDWGGYKDGASDLDVEDNDKLYKNHVKNKHMLTLDFNNVNQVDFGFEVINQESKSTKDVLNILDGFTTVVQEYYWYRFYHKVLCDESVSNFAIISDYWATLRTLLVWGVHLESIIKDQGSEEY
ncbi:MAG TPA: hypothetical protein VIQ31_05010, partial [Phormidium sp.]